MKRTALLLSAVSFQLSVTALAQVPGIINYQGRVIASGTNFDGSGQFEFALVNAAGTTNYWSNDGTAAGQPAAAVSLTVIKGLYSILLGDTSIANMTVAITPGVFANSDVRLRVWFNDGVNGFQQLSPDQRLASVGYALVAANAGGGSSTGDVAGARLNIGAANSLSGDFATIAGGSNNTASGITSAVGGGLANAASGNYATVAGGASNTGSGLESTVAGGHGNTAGAPQATVAGGEFNSVGTQYATIGGGYNNAANGYAATVPGGYQNSAAGAVSFAAGYKASANHDGAFVWNDNTNPGFSSTAENQFLIHATGGVGIGTASPGMGLDVGGTALDVAGTIRAFRTNGPIQGLRIEGIAGSSVIGLGDGSTLGAVSVWSLGRKNTDNSFRLAYGTDSLDSNIVLAVKTDGSVGIGTNNPVSALHVNGTITASGFSGDGAGLTNLQAANLTGTISQSQLPAAVVTNNANGVTVSGTFNGSLNGNATSATSANNATTANNFSGSLAGDVTGTQGATVVGQVGGVTAANVASGANAANAATSANTANAIVKRDGSGNITVGTVNGNLNGNATTATTAANFTGNVADNQLSANVPLLNGKNTFSGSTNTFNGVTSTAGGLIIENRTSDPPSPATGQMWLRTDL